MHNAGYHCPICKGNVFSTMMEPLHRTELLTLAAGDTLYCPSCEMLVEPILGSPSLSPVHDHLGRSRTGGSNAGGSQRGDLSDQGASQWRQDPQEGERNTWLEKDGVALSQGLKH